MSEMYEKMDMSKDFSFAHFNRQINSLSPEVKKLLFTKKDLQIIDDITLIYKNIPENINPSGTAKTIEMKEFDIMTPSSYFQEFQSKIKKWLLENPEKASRIGRKVNMSDFLKSTNTIKYKAGLKSFFYNKDNTYKSNQLKFTNQGLNKVIFLTGNQDFQNLDFTDSEVKRLLMQASSQKTDSKVMQSTIKKLEKKLKGGK